MPSYEQFKFSGSTPLRVHNRHLSLSFCNILAAGLIVLTVSTAYETYKSPYGPGYKYQPNIMGLTFPKAARYGSIASGFAVAGGIFALFFFGDVPKVRKDILSHLPVVGEYFVKEIPPEDNPF